MVEREDTTECDVVVGIGASAGGLDALKPIFEQLPAKSRASYLVVQHLGEDAPEGLSDVLDKESSVPVVTAEDGMSLEPNTAYVGPAHRVVTVEDQCIRVNSPRDRRQKRRLIDAMFSSVAQQYGEGAVAVILSGNDADGMTGARAVAEAGGLVIAQSAETAEFEIMPSSAVDAGVVDLALDPGQIPAELAAYCDDLAELREGDRRISGREIADRIPEIARIVRRETGHDFTHYKKSTLVRRIRRRMRILHMTSVEDYVRKLADDPEEPGELFGEILITVSSFFRDDGAFEALSQQALPELVAQRRSQDALRIWVPGCATGEEAYSFAMLVVEQLDDIDPVDRPDIQLFGTDIDDEVLCRARRGVYPPSVVADVDEQRLERFFEADGDRYRVTEQLREICLFAEHNILRDPPFVDLDLVSCRNLMIYLERELQEQLLLIFHHSLRADGFLFLGSSETVSSRGDLFRKQDTARRLWRNTADTGAPRPELPMHELGGSEADADGGDVEDDEELQDHFQKILVEKYAARAAVVRRDGTIVFASSGLERYLNIARGRFRNDLIKMVSPGLRMGLRGALKTAVEEEGRAVQKNLTFHGPEGTQPARVVVEPMPETDECRGLYLVVFEETGVPVEQAVEEATDIDEQAEEMIRQLEHELESTRENLERTVQDLETTNEELKSSNEELRSMNEELQTANQQLDHSKKEVERANEKLRASRDDLENLMQSADVATLFLADDGTINMFTPGVTDLYRLRDSDVGRPIDEITDRGVDMPRLPAPEDLEGRDVPVEDELRTEDGRWYIRRVSPYRTGEGERRGMVVTFSDVTKLKKTTDTLRRRSNALEEAKKRAETLSESKSEFLAEMSHELRTPLTAIVGYSHILMDRLEGTEHRDSLEIIDQNAEFLVEIIDDILDLSKIEEGRLDIDVQPIDLREAVDEVISMVECRAEQQKLAFSFQYDDDLPETIETDSSRLQQILRNLLDNAIEYTDEGEVEARFELEDGEEPALCCRISDTGPGIAPEEQQVLFEPFVRGTTAEGDDHQGAGLGLAISQRLTEELGGKLAVDSAPGEGTTFALEIPIRGGVGEGVEPSGTRASTAEPESPDSLAGARVLVADDSEEIRDIVRHFLEQAGAKVREASMGTEVLRRVEQVQREPPFDLIVMDIQMPELDGYEATRRLRSRGFEEPILAVTAAALIGDAEKCRDAGCTDYLTKPIDPDDLVDAVARHVGEPGA